jgi:hypothetical protein
LNTYCFASDFGGIRIGGALGLGQGGAKSENVVRTEGPLGVAVTVDYSLEPRWSLGEEQERSMSGAATSIGFTGVTLRWYFWTPQPQRLIKTDDQIERSFLIQKNFVPYLGTSVGFAQASFPAKDEKADVLVVSPYFSFKGGLEYPITGRWGARSEFMYGMTAGGKGAAEILHLLFGFYYFL